MTTIAYDGRTLAADTLATDDYGLKTREGKLWALHGCRFGAAGALGDMLRIRLRLQQMAKRLSAMLHDQFMNLVMAEDFLEDGQQLSLLMVAPDGRFYTLERGVFRLRAEGFGAIGSGRDYALAAMHLGQSAAQAVAVAAQFDAHTGAEIETLEAE